MCTFGLSGCRVKPRAASGAAGASHDSPRTPNVHICGKGKKARNCGPHYFGAPLFRGPITWGPTFFWVCPHPSGPHHDTHQIQNWIGQNWSNQDGQNGIGQSRVPSQQAPTGNNRHNRQHQERQQQQHQQTIWPKHKEHQFWPNAVWPNAVMTAERQRLVGSTILAPLVPP